MHPLVPKLLREPTNEHDNSLPFLASYAPRPRLMLRSSSAGRTSFRVYFWVYRTGSSEASAFWRMHLCNAGGRPNTVCKSKLHSSLQNQVRYLLLLFNGGFQLGGLYRRITGRRRRRRRRSRGLRKYLPQIACSLSRHISSWYSVPKSECLH